MAINSFNLLNFNASRCKSLAKIETFSKFLDDYDPLFVCIQEIHVSGALKVFSKKYQVFINLESGSNDGVGIVTLIKNGVNIFDSIIGLNGRIIGVKVQNIQIWNVYPKSGSGFKKEREIFFREQLSELMVQWKDSTKYIFQLGDHNCTHRMEDSLYNGGQHLQAGLIKHMKINGLFDDFLNVHGNDAIMYSRITNTSKTRIDYILSNSKACSYFQYVDMLAGLDHKVVIARYDIPISIVKESIPKDKFFSGWVISRRLESDEIFLEEAKSIFCKIHEESGSLNETLDPSFYWLKTKSAIISLAKRRERELFWEDNNKMKILKGFYSSIVKDIQNGIDCFAELENIKQDMNKIYKEQCKFKIDKMRGIEIDDYTYDIHKLQNQRKFENQSKIREIKIGDLTYSGTPNVVKAIEDKIRDEVASYDDIGLDAPPTPEELFFLSKLESISLSDAEKVKLLSPTNSDEIGYILYNEVDLDSSPGEDGLTYRFIKIFWEWQDFKNLYLDFLNFTRENCSSGLLENFGIMTVKNKKVQSNEYDKKRKLTKINKDTNLGNGKVWTNRLKQIILPKILPKNQFNCQTDVNIIDEVREIRTVNKFLLGEEQFGQIDGTILSIDFKDAFRSISLRWFNLVMKRLEIPKEFLDWFWTMYRDLYVVIVINKFKSEKIFIKRGFMEGSPPSMAAFVISLIPLMLSVEEKMMGIVTPDDKVHRIKLFADDLKLFIKDLGEIGEVYDVICKFEQVSGLLMHRDPARGKCQALPFGSHRDNNLWPAWVSVKNKMKVVGAMFSNNEPLETINSNLVSQCFFNSLNKSFGIKGTIFQKAYFVNTYLFSKLWYSAQCFKIDKKILENILSKALKFIYAGENEMPVRPLNFRSKSLGGIGLINPILKSKALLIKNMYKDFLEYDCSINDEYIVSNLYGYPQEFVKIYKDGLATAPVKLIYNFILKDLIYVNESLIPSRNERKSANVKWSLAWKNLTIMKGLIAEEKCFAWKVQQDMLAIGVRIHRQNAERRCLTGLDGNQLCLEV